MAHLIVYARQHGAGPEVLGLLFDRDFRLRREARARLDANAGLTSTGPWDGEPPATWAEVVWPEWVPAKVREQVESFWDWHGGPRPYARQRGSLDNIPPFGARVRLRSLGRGYVEGRYVHAWNNIGRVIADDGTAHCVSTCRDPEADRIERELAGERA